MKVPMKTIWSTFVSFLLLLLVLMFAGFGVVASKPWPVKLGAAAMGFCFLSTFISASWPESRGAGKLVKAANLCAGGLFAAALLLVLQHYFSTVPMR